MSGNSSDLKRKDTSKDHYTSPFERLRRWILSGGRTRQITEELQRCGDGLACRGCGITSKTCQIAAVHAAVCASLDESFSFAVLGSLNTNTIWHDWTSQCDPVESVKQQTALLLDYGAILRDRPANCDWKRIRSALLSLCPDGSASRLISGNTSCEVNLDPGVVQSLMLSPDLRDIGGIHVMRQLFAALASVRQRRGTSVHLQGLKLLITFVAAVPQHLHYDGIEGGFILQYLQDCFDDMAISVVPRSNI